MGLRPERHPWLFTAGADYFDAFEGVLRQNQKEFITKTKWSSFAFVFECVREIDL